MSKGRKPYDAIILQEILLQDDCRTVDDNGRVYAPSHEVYQIISKDMEDRGSYISPRHVHTIINDDRNGFKTLVIKKYGIQTSETSENNNTPNDDSTRNATFNSSESSHSRTIKLVLSPENWLQMTPTKLISGLRVYWKFKAGWTDVIADKIVQQHGGVACVFSFKNNLVNPTATARCYAKFTGFCVECKGTIQGELLKEPQKEVDVIITCHIDNIIPEEHTGQKKRQLRGERRKRVANILIDQHKEAVTYRREEVKRLKRFGEREPATLPTCAVLRKAKEQQLLKIYGLTFSNPVTNLLHQSKCGKYAGSIHAISALKFSCIYWTPEQFQIYVARCKKDQTAVLTIDATGGIGQRNNKQDPHIFLYQCMLVTSEGSVPVFQMVSADQSALQIGNFLRLTLSKRAPIPPIVVSDFGWALLIAVSQTFGKCSDLKDYLQRCYDILVKENAPLPATYIRLDVSHLVSMLTRWKSLKDQGQGCAVRRFYLRCLCQAHQTSNFTDLSYLLESILAVSLSEYVGYTSDGLALPAEKRLHFLNNIIKGVSVDGENDHLGNSDEDRLDNNGHEPHVINTSWTMWTASLYDTAQAIGRQSTHGSIINACFNPRFAKQLRTQLLPYLPLWTGIMRRFFERGSAIATSSSVEAEFNDLKNRAFKGQLPMRVDKFVLQHLDHLDGKIRLASNPSDLTNVGDKQSTTIESPSIRDLQVSRDNATSSIIQPTNDSQNLSEIQNVTDDFSTGEIKHSTPNSFSTKIKSADEHPTAQTHSEIIEVSSSDCNPSGEYTIPDSINVSNNENVLTSIEFSAGDIDSSPNTGHVYESEHLEDLNVCENWRGMGEKSEAIKVIGIVDEPKTKRANPSYLDNCPEWEFVKDAKLGTIPMFRNGFLSGTIQVGRSKINLIRTCAFDSMVQIILHTMSVNRTYYQNVESSISPIMKLALKMLHDKKLSSSHLQERAKILLSMRILKDSLVTYTRNIQKLDANCNVSHMTDDLFIRDPSFIKKIECTCGYKNKRSIVMVNVNVNILMYDGLQYMQRSIDDAQVMNGVCFKCKNPIKETREYGSHIMIDLSVFTDTRYLSDNKQQPKEIQHTLDSVASTVKLGNNTYMIAGVVDYCSDSEHYIAYAKSGMYWSCYNDLYPKRMNANPRSIIRPHLIVYALVQNQ